jgi:dihydroorotase
MRPPLGPASGVTAAAIIRRWLGRCVPRDADNAGMDTLTLTRPDDWHLHLRDGDAMAAVLPHTARQFARAIVMPNLRPPVTTTAQAEAYRARILAALPAGLAFEPLMTLYLTDSTPADEIRRARDSGFVHGVKLYPAGATTNSDSGVTDIRKPRAALEAMQETGLPLLVHGEVTHAAVDVFDREKVFIDEVLHPLRKDFPRLRVVFEHITTREAALYVRDASGPIAATITPHHLLYSRNALFMTADGRAGVRPHYYCLPVLKREAHRLSLLEAATSGNPRYFLGTDSAPHPKGEKETACGCAGCYTALNALELYAEAFEDAGRLDRLEAFASHFGADFYGLPRNRGTVTLLRRPATVPREVPFGATTLVPLRAGEWLRWSFAA